MKFQLKNIAVVLFSVVALSSCSNDSDTISETSLVADTGSIKFKFDNVVGNGTPTPDNLVLDTPINLESIILSVTWF